MSVFEEIESRGHKQIVFCNEPRVGLRAIIAIHNTSLGPALGGTRMWMYASGDDALRDAVIKQIYAGRSEFVGRLEERTRGGR